MTQQDVLDLIACSLNVARAKAKKGTLDKWQSGFHTGQVAGYMNLGFSPEVNAAAANAQAEINQLFTAANQ